MHAADAHSIYDDEPVVVPTGAELDQLAARLFPILLPTLCSRLKIVPAIPAVLAILMSIMVMPVFT